MTFCISFRRCNHCTKGSGKEPDHLQGSDAAYIQHAVVISNAEGWCMVNISVFSCSRKWDKRKSMIILIININSVFLIKI